MTYDQVYVQYIYSDVPKINTYINVNMNLLLLYTGTTLFCVAYFYEYKNK